MKMPKLSKQGMKEFFLYHTEKLIIGLALAMMVAFFWMGYKSEVFDQATPSELANMAVQAEQHVVSKASWDAISESRQANREFLEPILNNPGISASEFRIDPSSVIVKSLAPRNDPRLRTATELSAVSFTAPVFLGTTRNVKNPIDNLPWPADGDDENSDRPKRRNTRQKEEVKEIKIPGEALPLVQHHEMRGVRPTAVRLSKNDRVFLLNGVAVTGLVDVKQQFADFQKSFAFGVGYYPARDRPVYKYMQVERAEVVDGKKGLWKDISERLWDGQPRLYPAFAPEVVSPDNFDEILTGPIPPITIVDYTPFSLHPKTELRTFPGLEEAEDAVAADVDADALFQRGQDEDSAALGRRAGRGRSSGRPDRASSPRRLSRSERPGRRQGSDFSKYEDAMAAEAPTVQYKLARFFDLQIRPEKTYQYRVRLWLADPNNDLEAALKKSGSKKSNRGGDSGMHEGGGMGMGMDTGMGGGMGMGASPATRGAREELGPDGKPKKAVKKVAITNSMISPEARARLGRAREEADPKDSDRVIYYVTERRVDEDGKETFEEVQVPRGRDELDELRFARPTPWSDPVSVTVSSSQGLLAAGKVEPPREARVGSVRVPDGEPVADVVVAEWSNEFKTMLPARRKARRGEVMNFTADSHLLNPLQWSVHVSKKQPIKSDFVIVDVMGGEQLNVRRDELMSYALPGEVFVMSSSGEFEVHNDLDDQQQYRHALFIHDDSPEVGEVKVKKEKPDRRRGVR